MTDVRPQVSVVVPARDAGGHLPDALGSLRRQGLDPWDLEVVVVDDGSTDDTAEVLEEASTTMPGLRWMHHRTSLGVSAARNRGIREARGHWVTFLDPDDWYYPGHLAAMLAAARSLDVDFLVCDQVQGYGNERRRIRSPEPRRHVALEAWQGILPTDRTTMVNYVQVSTRMVSRRLVDDGLVTFDEDLPTAEDREWAWRLLLGSQRFAAVDAPGYVYRRQVANSLTAIGDVRQLGFLDAYDKVLDLVRRPRGGHLEGTDLEPKVLRDLLAVLHHHVKRRSVYPDDVWSAMTARADAVVGRFEAPVRAVQRAAIGTERAKHLHQQGVHV